MVAGSNHQDATVEAESWKPSLAVRSTGSFEPDMKTLGNIWRHLVLSLPGSIHENYCWKVYQQVPRQHCRLSICICVVVDNKRNFHEKLGIDSGIYLAWAKIGEIMRIAFNLCFPLSGRSAKPRNQCSLGISLNPQRHDLLQRDY